MTQRSFVKNAANLEKSDGENSTEESEDDDFIQKFKNNCKQSGLSPVFKQPEISASMKAARIGSSGSAVSKENNDSFGRIPLPCL